MIYIWSLIKLLGSSLALCHVVATLYYFLALYESIYLGLEENWVSVQGLDNASPFIVYNQSYYWAMSSIINNYDNYDNYYY